MIPQFALDPFGFTAAETSRLMLINSGMQLLSQGVIVPNLSTPALWKMQGAALLFSGVPLLILATAPTSGLLFAFCVGSISVSWHVLGMVVNTSLSCLVPVASQGIML